MTQVQPTNQLSLDNVQEQGFISYFKNMEKKPSTTMRFFDRGEYFTAHGEDAVFAAKEFFRTSSVIKMLGGSRNALQSVTLSKLNFESFVRDLLLVKQYRVEVYKQKNAGKNDWQNEYKASPGNLVEFEEILFGSSNELVDNSGVVGVKMSPGSSSNMVGVSFLDINSRHMWVSEFSDGDSFNNLEAMIVQLSPKECIVPIGDLGSAGVKLKQVLSRNNLLITERKRSDFSEKDAAQDLCRLLRLKGKTISSVSARPEMDMKNAVAALIATLKYLELLADESNFNQYHLATYELKNYMRLDTAALRALHVDKAVVAKEENKAQNTTLLSLLDHCRTAHGHRMIAQWLRQPLVDINKIVERQDMVNCLVESFELREGLGDEHLRKIPDLYRLARKLARKNASLQDCYRMYQCFNQLPMLCELLGRYEGEFNTTLNAVFITPLQELISDLSKYQEMIETTMDLGQAGRGEFIIKPDFDDTLQELYERLEELEGDIEKQLRIAASDLSLEAGKGVKLESNAQMGYFLRVTLKDEKVLRNNRTYRILDTNKAGVRFRNSQLQNLNEEFIAVKQEYGTQQKNVVDEIIAVAAGYEEVVQNLSSLLATLDCIYSLATVACSASPSYVRPKLLPKGEGTLCLKECRHPCVEKQEGVSFIPNDCEFSKEKGIFHILTGPNMGGKSTFLRSVGVTVLLAQIGAFVPCTEAHISIVDSILARVGASDCQLKGVSTFMAEMLETSTILKSATVDSLIIIDELGRGTSTYDGFGLAWAISEHIAKEIGSFCLFATHFHELTSLADEQQTVKNYHVTATTQGGTLTLLYEVKPGSCDRSFGIHVAQLANFPKQVIEYAKRKASELEDGFGGDEEATEEEVKRRKEEKQIGEEVIDEYLKKVSDLDLSEMTEDGFQNKISVLKKELEAVQNPYIQYLLSIQAS